MMRTLKQLKRSMIAMLLVVCMICTNTLPAFADQAVASTMRLAKTEGKVSVTNKNGRDMGTMADMKLFNGYNLGTEQASYAWIGLDDSKIVKLDAVSEAEIQKKGKDLEVLLNSGNLFFNVTESLKADETLNIRTSTMVTGIRGTCGWVKVLDSWRTEVFILEGSVECWVMDPVTGQAKTVRLGAGQKATFVVYDQMREGDKCDIIMGTYGENDIDPFVAVELLNDPDLCNRVDGVTGLNIGAIISNAEARLDAEEQEVAQKNQVIQNQLFNQPNLVKDPVFETSNDDGGQSSGGSTPPVEEPEEEVGYLDLYMPISAKDLNDALRSNNVRLHAKQGSDANDPDNALTINQDRNDENDNVVTVPERGENVTELAVDENVTINVNWGGELRVNGTLKADGNVVNNGTITNTSMNTLEIAGALTNNAGAEINNTGRIVATDGLNNTGDVYNFGTIEGTLGLTGGSLSLFEGSVLDSTPLTIDGSVLNLYGSELSSVTVQNNGELVMYDGTVAMLDATNANVEIYGGEISTVTFDETMATMFGGTVTNGMVVRGNILFDETGQALPSLSVKGGTINSGSSDAAILVNMSVDTANSDIPNVIIASDVSGDNIITIDAESESASAIKVLSGQVEVDEGSLGTSLFLKAKNLDNIVNGREALEDMYVYIYALTGENNDNFMDLTMTHSLYANEGEGGYLLKVVEPGLQDLIDRASSGETIQTIQMKGNDRTELSYSVDSGNIVLDLNGNILDCGGFSVGEDAVLKVIDTKNKVTEARGVLNCTELMNDGNLELNDVDTNFSSVENYGEAIITNTNINTDTENAYESCTITNYGSMTVDGGQWNVGDIFNVVTATINNLNIVAGGISNGNEEGITDYEDITSKLIITGGDWKVYSIGNSGSMEITNGTWEVQTISNNSMEDGESEESGETDGLTISGGTWTVEEVYNNVYATMTIDDGEWLINSMSDNTGELTLDGVNMALDGSIRSFGKLVISGDATIMKDEIQDTMDAMFYISKGTAEFNGATLSCTTESESKAGYALICNDYLSQESSGDDVEWLSEISLTNTVINAGNHSAIYLNAGHALVVNKGVNITSASAYGAICYEAASDEYYDSYEWSAPIQLNDGMITNNHAEAGVINQHNMSVGYWGRYDEVDFEEFKAQLREKMIADSDDIYATILIPSAANVGTELVADRGSGQPLVYESGMGNDQLLELISNGYSYTYEYIQYDEESGAELWAEDREGVGYLVYTASNASQNTSVLSLMSLRPATPTDAEEATDSDAIEGDLPEDNDNLGGSGDDDVIGDSSDNDDDDDTSSGNIGTGTDTNATEQDGNTETASGGNATGNGDPMTGAPAAIPLAAALLGIWMSMPKEYKRRNRKEC